MSKVIWLAQTGDPDVLRVREIPTPSPTSEQVLIRIETAGVIFGDLLVRRGLGHPGTPKMPFVPGNEAVGIIESVGSAVTDLSTGQRVVALMHAGGYATHVCTEGWRCVLVPDSVTPEKAVCIPVNYWTAYYLLHHAVTLQAGQRILIHGIGGGLGSALAQLGKLMGLEIYGTASAAKHKEVQANGAIPIDYRTVDFVQRIKALTGDGVDVVYDTIGGSYWSRSHRTLRAGGTLVVCGIRISKQSDLLGLLLHGLKLLPRILLQRNRKLKIVFLQQDQLKDIYRHDLPLLLQLLAEQKIDPVIGAKIPLTEAARAHMLLEKSEVVGKIVLCP